MRHRVTVAAGTDPIFLVWNPHASLPVRLTQVGWQANTAPAAAPASFSFDRASARGTPTSTVTASQVHDEENDAAPLSGLLIDDCAAGTPPTWITPSLYAWSFQAVAASAIVIPLARGLLLPPGTGFGMRGLAGGAITNCDVMVAWEE